MGDTHGAVAPAGNGLINGLAALDVVRAHGQDVNQLAVQLIASTQQQLFEAIQHIQFGDAQASQTIDLRRAFEQRGIKPATATAAPGGHALFGAHGAHVITRCARHLPIQLGWERAAAHAGAISLGNAQDVVQHARAHAGAGGGIARHAVA